VVVDHELEASEQIALEMAVSPSHVYSLQAWNFAHSGSQVTNINLGLRILKVEYLPIYLDRFIGESFDNFPVTLENNKCQPQPRVLHRYDGA
jgi:hypothetical protein